MPIDAVRVGYQMAVLDIPPTATVPDERDVIGGVVNGTGDELA
jgi:hypothetical protein